MTVLPINRGDDISGAAREWLRWGAWRSMETGLILLLAHLVVVPLAYTLMLGLAGWNPGPTPAWWDWSIWAVPVLLMAGPPLMLAGDRADARRRRRHAEEHGCVRCQEARARRGEVPPPATWPDAA